MASYNNKKNLLQSRSEYSRHYGAFRGVDFSSEHTQVHESRFAYLVNMYKDYRSGQGVGVETIPGFRRRFVDSDEGKIHGIHTFCRYYESGNDRKMVLVHCGKKLYWWLKFPFGANITDTTEITLLYASNASDDGVYEYRVDNLYGTILSVVNSNGDELTYYVDSSAIIHIFGEDLFYGDTVIIHALAPEALLVYDNMNSQKSVSFVFNNRVYILDGKNYLWFDGTMDDDGNYIHNVLDAPYVPTTYKGLTGEDDNETIKKKEYEQRNLLSQEYKNTFRDLVFEKDFSHEAEIRLLNPIFAKKASSEYENGEWEAEMRKQITVYADETELKYGEHYYFAKDFVGNGGKPFVCIEIKPIADLTVREISEDSDDVVSDVIFTVIVSQKPITSVSGIPQVSDASKLITGCTIATIFDERIFLSGNPTCPNHIFYSERHDGYVDPSYFGVLNVQACGTESGAPITGMIPLTNTLAVLKGDTQQDGSVYYLTPTETGYDVQPKIYTSEHGLHGLGCLGACVNFLDDPIFISRLGVEAIGQLSVRNERALEHRSFLIDAKLSNLDLSKAALAEWGGYLVLLVDGKIFLADSRQPFTHESGVKQYEWYYLEDIGVWDGQYAEYRYSVSMPPSLSGKKIRWCTKCQKSHNECSCSTSSPVAVELKLANAVYDYERNVYENLMGEVANPPGGHHYVKSARVTAGLRIDFMLHEKYKEDGTFECYEALLCEPTGAYIGGGFCPAVTLAVMDDNLFFGTTNGVICSFNFDQRNEDGEIPPEYYTFDGRTIVSGCATKMDNCGIPHLNKNTVKKSTVIKTKTFPSSAAKLKVRTNRKPYEQIARINNSSFAFDSLDFSEFSFITSEQSLFAVKEKEKKWVEKQYFIYSDEIARPFALFSVSFRYHVSGRYKE